MSICVYFYLYAWKSTKLLIIMNKLEFLFNLDNSIKNIYGNSILSIIRFPIKEKMKKIIRNNEQIKNIKRHDKCYVIGLGPSLNKVDMSKLGDGDIIVTNRFYKNENAQECIPSIYVMMDPGFYGEYRDTLEMAKKQYPNTCFLQNGRYYSKKIDDERTFWLLSWSGTNKLREKPDLTEVIPTMLNVVCYAIYCALYMEYREIILLGCDFNFFATPKMVHSYGVEDRVAPLRRDLFGASFAIYEHELLQKNAEMQNIKIINATDGSLIDTYCIDDNVTKKYLKE